MKELKEAIDAFLEDYQDKAYILDPLMLQSIRQELVMDFIYKLRAIYIEDTGNNPWEKDPPLPSGEITIEDRITECGQLGYPLSRIAILLNLPEVELRNPDTKYNKAYKSGRMMAQLAYDRKLLQMANSGDPDAMHELEKRRVHYMEEEEATDFMGAWAGLE